MLLLEGGEETLALQERWDHKDCKVEWHITNFALFLHFFPSKVFQELLVKMASKEYLELPVCNFYKI